MTSVKASTEQRLPGLEGFDVWGNARILDTLLAGQRRALDAVERALPTLSLAADGVAARLSAGGKLFYSGAGSSIRIGVQDGAELPATFGMKQQQIAYLIAGGRPAMFETLADAEDDAAEGEKDAQTCTAKDALLAIAASGRTPYTIAAAKRAKANGCLVVAIVNNTGSLLGAAADIEILLDSGPEVISGSTRMGAGTAQKAALNMLSTLVHTKLGAVHDGYMVNVEASNSKLAKRAASIVSAISGATTPDATEALAKTQGNVKTAVLVLKGAADSAAARQFLSETNGNLRAALIKLKSKA